ncbi:hypothetical protein BDN72DRAFT_864510 [Pluteus cervinus]|uniref:Uncharacterized protein n=1 Tax=Pluteus cervinus TaxID=181527 RepID=A0ACD3A3T1_9AGAR|nr:hypothetical protein BDN72DRAFT_864510 [Pluteus cervinus]
METSGLGSSVAPTSPPPPAINHNSEVPDGRESTSIGIVAPTSPELPAIDGNFEGSGNNESLSSARRVAIEAHLAQAQSLLTELHKFDSELGGALTRFGDVPSVPREWQDLRQHTISFGLELDKMMNTIHALLASYQASPHLTAGPLAHLQIFKRLAQQTISSREVLQVLRRLVPAIHSYDYSANFAAVRRSMVWLLEKIIAPLSNSFASRMFLCVVPYTIIILYVGWWIAIAKMEAPVVSSRPSWKALRESAGMVASRNWLETKAAGSPIIAHYQRRIRPVIECAVTTSYQVRASSDQSRVRMGFDAHKNQHLVSVEVETRVQQSLSQEKQRIGVSPFKLQDMDQTRVVKTLPDGNIAFITATNEQGTVTLG